MTCFFLADSNMDFRYHHPETNSLMFGQHAQGDSLDSGGFRRIRSCSILFALFVE